jgi:glycosyltransferase involved in cell wall biosynthesis
MTTSTTPVISIVTVNYNHAPGLRETLDSVFTQSGVLDLEQIVIDGGSTDGSVDVLKLYAEQIHYAVSEPDKGIYHAMNKGIRASSGDYVLFLNSGDRLCDRDVLSDMTPALQGRQDLVYGNSLQKVEEEGRTAWKEGVAPSSLTPLVFFRSGICHQAVFFKRTLLNELKGYDESYRIAGDWELVARALLAGCQTLHVNRAVACYEGDGLSRKMREVSEAEKQRLLDQHFPPGLQQDYQDYLACRSELIHLREVETWRQQILRQSWWLNLAMISKWRFKRKNTGLTS